jgi:hypothetical protein
MTRRLNGTEIRILCALYWRSPLTMDDLAYTPEFEALRSEFNNLTGRMLDSLQVWRLLSNALKKKLLPQKGR